MPVVVSAIIDPDLKRAALMLEMRRAKEGYTHLYEHTTLYSSLTELWNSAEKPDCMFVGLPPECHGSTKAPFDVELQCAQRGVHLFVEKPLSCYPLDEVRIVGETLHNTKGLVVSVGYMLRYCGAVRKMKELISQRGWKVVATVARYNCAYASILKQAWWDDRRSGGPIVEQATHFCDLSRFFAGEVELPSLNAIAVAGAGNPLSPLTNISKTVDESTIDPEHRIPRTTAAFWRYNTGAIGSLNHALLLQGTKYTSEFEVWGDGFRMVLVDPYHACKLYVRTLANDEDVEVEFERDDMYYNELVAFMDAVHDKVNGIENAERLSKIRSTYEDALKTYELTWAIRLASEKK